MLNDKYFFTLMALSRTPEKGVLINACHYFTDPIPWNLETPEIIEGLNKLYSEKLNIIQVADIIEYPEQNRFEYGKYTTYKIPSSVFFEDVVLTKTFIEEVIDLNQTVFMFHKINYTTIKNKFDGFGMTLSAGSISKRNLISPVQLRLSRFILALSEYTGTKVANSFHVVSNKQSKSNNTDFQNPKRGLHTFSRTAETVRRNKNPLGQYLNYIEETIKTSVQDPEAAQKKIENIWIDLIENKLKKDKYLIDTYSGKLHSLLFEAQITLEVLSKKQALNRRFPTLCKIGKLDRIEYILLTFVWCCSYSNRLSYTSISRSIGENIIYNIFKKSEINSYSEFKTEIKYSVDLVIKLGD